MKNFTLLAIVLIFLASCEKFHLFNKEKENLCPVVTSEQMPAVVTKAFSTKYTGTMVTTWFNKDNTGYCAVFISNGNQTKALFDNNGNFVKEETELENNNQTGDHQDGDGGCECELKDRED